MNKFEYILQNVEKPQQYTGHEYGSRFLSPDAVADRKNVRFLLSFPDTYDVGMSNFAIKILYEILESIENVVVDRAFVPAEDYAALLEKTGHPMTSLNYGLPVADFDVVGFTFEYELNYSNALYFMNISGIPMLSSARGEGHPIVIAGGSACVNPEPMADFIDVFFVGDGEPMLPEITSAIRRCKESGASRAETIMELSKINGAYVPAYYDVEFDSSHVQTGLRKKYDFAPGRIAMRRAPNLDECRHPVKFLVPNFETIFNRGVVEIARGCKNACRFCQAGFIYRPYRERSLENIKKIASDIFKNTGYSEFTLTSLSATDHPHLGEMIDYILNMNKQNEAFSETLFSVSLPSQRISTFSVELASSLAKNRKSGLTFAPEAGSQRMRDILNKNVTAADLFNTVESAINAGYRLVKLYFMLGLPFETEEDLQEIVNMISRVSAMAKEKRARGFSVNVTFSTFVPKPHTPFQWAAQASRDKIYEKQSFLKHSLKHLREVTMKFTNSGLSILESAFARGSRELSKVLLNANKLGAKFDAWDEKLRPEIWEEAFKMEGINLSEYACREFRLDEQLPWSVVDTGVNPAFLQKEYENARAEKSGQICDPAVCKRCGVC